MHQSVLDFVARVLPLHLVEGRNVLEVGSYDVNGSVRPWLQPSAKRYWGVDMREGPHVDEVLDITASADDIEPAIGSLAWDKKGSWDIVVAAEVLEHVEHWHVAIENLQLLLKPGGTLVVTTRSLGFPLHEFPNDYWRFSVSDFTKIFANMDILALEADSQVPGVFICAKKHNLRAIQVYSMGTP